ncbi:group ii intron maturase-specific, partial [Lucifera butyrica]
KRTTSRKKFRAKLKYFAEWLYQNMHTEIGDLIKQINAKLAGHYRYYGVTDNSNGIHAFGYRIRRKILEVLNRRSQKNSLTWEGFAKLEERFPLVNARIYVNIYG